MRGRVVPSSCRVSEMGEFSKYFDLFVDFICGSSFWER
jgi:hypothetical protein